MQKFYKKSYEIFIWIILIQKNNKVYTEIATLML